MFAGDDLKKISNERGATVLTGKAYDSNRTAMQHPWRFTCFLIGISYFNERLTESDMQC